jgi:amino-acid N-acetyltransferase
LKDSDSRNVATLARLRSAKPSDLESVLNLLKAENLPRDGVSESFGDGYIVAEFDGTVLGVAGIERHGDFALLRSVDVTTTHRCRGIGGQLVRNRLAQARETGASGVYLLTTTAVDYFSRFGFEVVGRDHVPKHIRDCQEYRVSCPASATVMHLDFADKNGDSPNMFENQY